MDGIYYVALAYKRQLHGWIKHGWDFLCILVLQTPASRLDPKYMTETIWEAQAKPNCRLFSWLILHGCILMSNIFIV